MSATPPAVRAPDRESPVWTHHALPLASAAIATLILILTPFWAFDWFRRPFTGMLLEPTLVVNSYQEDGWAVREAGIGTPMRLVEVEGRPVSTHAEYIRALEALPNAPVALTFASADGTRQTLRVAPGRVSPLALVRLFVIPYLVGWAFLGIGGWVYRLRGHLRAGQYFLTFASALSIATSAFLDMATTHHVALAWALSLPIAAGAVTALGLVFPEPSALLRRWPAARFVAWSPAVVLGALTAREALAPSTPLAYIGVWLNNYLYAGIAILTFLVSLTVGMYRASSPTVRQQSRVIVLGAALAFAPITAFLLPAALGIAVPFLAAVHFPPLAIFPLSVAYAIVRYRLLDIDRALNRGVGYVLTSAAVVTAYLLLLNAVSLVVGRSLAANDPLVTSAFLLLLVVTLNPIRDLSQRAVNRVFYRTPVDYRRSLERFSRELTLTLDLDQALTRLSDLLASTLNPERASVYLVDEDAQLYRRYSPDDSLAEALPPDHEFVRELRAAAGSLFIAPDSRPLPRPGDLPSPEFVVYVPLRIEGRLTGWGALGPKKSGEPYTRDDLAFVDGLASQASLALENARLYANLRRNFEQTTEIKNLMDDIFASIHSGVIATDVQDKVTTFNRAAESILGIPAGRVLGQTCHELIPHSGASMAGRIESVKTGGRVEQYEIESSLPGRGTLNLHLSLAPLRDAHQSTIGVTIVVDDLTEQRRLEADRERIRQTFGRVVAPRVRDQLLSDPRRLHLEGARQEITILFADVRGFTTFSELAGPETLFKVLNSYLSLAAQAVLSQEGTIDKFMGDAVMALFNAPDPQPDHTLRAARAAIAMREALEAHRSLLDRTHKLYFGVGIHVGEAIVGNVGTPELFNYTAIGDAVNVAKRLQENAGPGQIILSAEAHRRVRDHVVANALPPIPLKGRQATETPFEVIRLARRA